MVGTVYMLVNERKKEKRNEEKSEEDVLSPLFESTTLNVFRTANS